MDTFEKLEYRIKAGIKEAKKEKEFRLADRMELPLKGLHGEKLFLTGMQKLNEKVTILKSLYSAIPETGKVAAVVLLDAHASATIEGAYTTVERMKHCLDKPESKDEKMVANTYKGCMFAYDHPINEENIRKLWDTIVEDVCDNKEKAGTKYRNGMVSVGNAFRTIHTPADVDEIPSLMDSLFAFSRNEELDSIIRSFVFHFYFVYVHPFCDGNGRTARTINNSQLFYGGYRKVKSLAIATVINRNLSGYYKAITDCEKVLSEQKKEKWLDLSPFVDFMLDMFEESMNNAVLAHNELSEIESKLLGRMNQAGPNAEITVKKAMTITGLSENATRKNLNRLANKGYLVIDTTNKTYIYKLMPHL